MRAALVALVLAGCAHERAWTALPAAPRIAGKQDDLFFVDEHKGWSVNGKGRIYHTTDGGQSFTLELEQPGTYFRAVLFTDALHGFAGNIGVGYYPGVTDERPLFRTTDGGKTWSAVDEITGPRPNGICNLTMVDPQHLVATGRVGGPSFLVTSSDGGATWTSRTVPVAMLIDAHFSSPTDGYLLGGSSTEDDSRTVVLHTADGGATFTEVYRSATPGEMGWKLAFPSATTGYASVLMFGAGKGHVLKTVDGGAHWQALQISEQPFMGLGIGFVDDQHGWVAGGDKKAPGFVTTDGGAHWKADRSLGAHVNRFRFPSPHVGYSIGSTIHKIALP